MPILNTDHNPYLPTVHTEQKCELDEGPSTWIRNFTCLATLALSYTVISLAFATTGHSLPPRIVYPLFGISFIASTWANFHAGGRIGLRQSGLPVMLTLVFGWAVTYICMSLLGAGLVYAVVDPSRMLH